MSFSSGDPYQPASPSLPRPQFPWPSPPPDGGRKHRPTWVRALIGVFAVVLVIDVIAAVGVGLAFGRGIEHARADRDVYEEQVDALVAGFGEEEAAWCGSGGFFLFDRPWAACMVKAASSVDQAVADVEELFRAAGYGDVDVRSDSSGDFGGGTVAVISAGSGEDERLYATVSDEYLTKVDEFGDETARVVAAPGGVVVEFYQESDSDLYD